MKTSELEVRSLEQLWGLYYYACAIELIAKGETVDGAWYLAWATACFKAAYDSRPRTS